MAADPGAEALAGAAPVGDHPVGVLQDGVAPDGDLRVMAAPAMAERPAHLPAERHLHQLVVQPEAAAARPFPNHPIS